MMKHELKIDKPYFEAVLSGDKIFEIRFNDRGFQKGDEIILNEIYKGIAGYKNMETGRRWKGVITYVSNYMQQDNYVVFGIKEI